jgi:predicted secreted protein
MTAATAAARAQLVRAALLCTLFSLCAFGSPARAGLEVLGFSTDGKHAVVLEHGVGEGSGYPWARAVVLDVAKNAAVRKPIEVTLESGDATEQDAVDKVKKAFEEARPKLNVAPLKAGKAIRHDEKGNLKDREGAPIGTVKLTSKKAKGKEAFKSCGEPFEAWLLTLTMYWMDDDTPAKLLVDKKVPKERACTQGCKLGGVFADGRSAVFELECAVQGYEGPATKSVAVSAKLAYGLDEDLPGSDAKPEKDTPAAQPE